jgi:uncharacterized protein (DUF4415 family)
MASPPRRPTSAIDRAEALFKKATTPPVAPAPKRVEIPSGKEMVTLRIDRDVLAHFQDEGPGWQERVNAALRRASGIDAATGGQGTGGPAA